MSRRGGRRARREQRNTDWNTCPPAVFFIFLSPGNIGRGVRIRDCRGGKPLSWSPCESSPVSPFLDAGAQWRCARFMGLSLVCSGKMADAPARWADRKKIRSCVKRTLACMLKLALGGGPGAHSLSDQNKNGTRAEPWAPVAVIVPHPRLAGRRFFVGGT